MCRQVPCPRNPLDSIRVVSALWLDVLLFLAEASESSCLLAAPC